MAITLSELLERYIEERPLRPASVAGFNASIKSLTRILKRNPELDSITLDEVVFYRTTLSNTVKAISYNSYLRQLQILLRFAVKKGLCSYSNHPILSLRRARVPSRKPPTVRDEFFSSALAFLSKPAQKGEKNLLEPRWFWWYLIAVLAYTGMHRRQLVELRWKDIDLKNWTIHFRAQNSKQSAGYTIPISNQLRPILSDLLARTEAQRGKVEGNDQVFCLRYFSLKAPDGVGRELTAARVTERLAKVAQVLSVQSQCSPRRLRHTAATRWANATGQLKAVQHILGHSEGARVQDYIHPDLDKARRALLDLPAR